MTSGITTLFLHSNGTVENSTNIPDS